MSLAGAAVIAAAQLDVPVVPGRDEARRWAEQELSQRVYQNAKPGLGQVVWNWIVRFVTDFLNGLNGLNGNLGVVLGLVLVCVLAGVAVWLIRPRLNRRLSAPGGIFDHAAVLSAAGHRKLSVAAADRGDFADALTERFRAIVRAAEERTVIDPQPGRTADEVTGQLIRAFAALRGPLGSAATLFNSVRYGNAATSSADYQLLVLLDRDLLAERAHYDDLRTEPAAPR